MGRYTDIAKKTLADRGLSNSSAVFAAVSAAEEAEKVLPPPGELAPPATGPLTPVVVKTAPADAGPSGQEIVSSPPDSGPSEEWIAEFRAFMAAPLPPRMPTEGAAACDEGLGPLPAPRKPTEREREQEVLRRLRGETQRWWQQTFGKEKGQAGTPGSSASGLESPSRLAKDGSGEGDEGSDTSPRAGVTNLSTGEGTNTVIYIPSKDRPDHLAKLIAQVKPSGFPIAVSLEAGDPSWKITGDYPDVRFEQLPDAGRGLGYAMNFMLNVLARDFSTIIKIDDDCRMAPAAVQRLAQEIETSPAIMVGAWQSIHDHFGGGGLSSLASVFALKTEPLLAHGGFDERFYTHEDGEFRFRLYFRPGPHFFTMCKDALFRHVGGRDKPGGQLHRWSDGDHRQIARWMNERFSVPGVTVCEWNEKRRRMVNYYQRFIELVQSGKVTDLADTRGLYVRYAEKRGR